MFSLRNISNRNVINVTVLRCQEGIVFLSFGNFFVKLIASVSDIGVFISLAVNEIIRKDLTGVQARGQT